MADVKWIKLSTDIFNDEKIQVLESMPEGKTMLCIWFKLLCLAGKTNLCGWICFADKIPYTDAMLASIFRESEATVRMAIGMFQKFGMIEYSDGGVLGIANWAKHQAIEGMEKVREDNRKRQAEFRRKKKEALLLSEGQKNNSDSNVISNVTSDVTVTLKRSISNSNSNSLSNNSIDINTNTNNKSSNKEKNKTINTSNISSYIEKYTTDENVRNALTSFVEMRKSIKKPLTAKAMELALKQLTKLAGDNPQLQQDIIEQSILHSWQTFYVIGGDKGRTLYTAQEQAGMRFKENTEKMLEIARQHDEEKRRALEEGMF